MTLACLRGMDHVTGMQHVHAQAYELRETHRAGSASHEQSWIRQSRVCQPQRWLNTHSQVLLSSQGPDFHSVAGQIGDLERVVLEAVGIVDAHLMATLLSRFKARQHLFALKRYLLLSQACPQCLQSIA